MQQVFDDLKVWRDERNLSIDSQRAGYAKNVGEELEELRDAAIMGSVNDMIDAVCDVAVLTINTIKEREWELVIPRLKNKEYISQLKPACEEYAQSGFSIECAINVLNACINECDKKGYSFIKSMGETIKEISSRVGSYDESRGKWVKDASEAARAKWYKADYSKAKLD